VTGASDDPLAGFECAPGIISRWVSESILGGRTYPHLPFVPDVQVVFDVGANCGATTVFFARHHRDATIHSFEPNPEPRRLLVRNTSAFSNVQVHPVGLHSHDMEVPLYLTPGDSGMASLWRRGADEQETDPVQIRAADAWAREHGVTRIDVLKVDVEGGEVAVLQSLAALLPSVKVLYVEYDSRLDRRAIDDLVRETHQLFVGQVFLDQGECVYLRNDLTDLDSARQRLVEIATVILTARMPTTTRPASLRRGGADRVSPTARGCATGNRRPLPHRSASPLSIWAGRPSSRGQNGKFGVVDSPVPT
jgi:FkbM family methyltransferase